MWILAVKDNAITAKQSVLKGFNIMKLLYPDYYFVKPCDAYYI